MSAAEVAAEAATTDWTTYDGVVAPQFMFYAVFFPLAMAAFLLLPAAICYCCLARGRLTPYTPHTPPNMGGAFDPDRKGPYQGSVNHGSVAER